MIDPVGGERRDLDQGRQIRFASRPRACGSRTPPSDGVPRWWSLRPGSATWRCVAGPGRARVLRPAGRAPDRGAYDKPGCGLSDPWPGPQTLDTDLEVLRAVADHLGLDRFDLLGISMAAPLSIAFAARHPERVGRLILYGGYANGHQIASAKVRAAMIDLVRAHWGLGSDVLADMFLPDGSAEAKAHFARLQRGAAPAEVACELLAQCYEIRVDDLLDRVAAPTLVLHRRDDRAIPYRLGRDLAARIPGARLVSLAGRSHLLYAGDAAAVVRAILEFLGASQRAARRTAPGPGTLTPGSSRSRPWSPTASPTGRSPAGWGSRSARPRGTWSASASGSASPPAPRSPPGGSPPTVTEVPVEVAAGVVPA